MDNYFTEKLEIQSINFEQYCPSALSDYTGQLSFLTVIKKRVMALIGEWEGRGGNTESWLNNEAIAVAKVQESGTFR